MTSGDQEFNQLIATYLLEQGHRVTVCFQNKDLSDDYFSSIRSDLQAKYYSIVISNINGDWIEYVRNEIEKTMNGLDILIHGNEMVDEDFLFEQNMLGFGEYISSQFNRMYLFNKMAAQFMMRPKSGKIIFPLIYDPLYYADYPSSPIFNQGKLSMMKCLSHELSAFKINVNAMTFGYHEKDSDLSKKKETKQMVEIFSLKPTLVELKEMIPALEILINPPVQNIGGENFHIGAGIETSL